jgi:hypothetical protein
VESTLGKDAFSWGDFMRNILGALALTAAMASQASAATISGETNAIAGQTYTYLYSPDAPSLIPGYLSYTMDIAVNDTGNPADNIWFSFAGPVYPASNQFSFDWVFNVTGPVVLNVQSVLATFFGTEFQFPEGTEFFEKEDGTLFRGQNSDTIPLKVSVTSVVPIGGTLPLMLTALGLMGWAARRRARQGALPA